MIFWKCSSVPFLKCIELSGPFQIASGWISVLYNRLELEKVTKLLRELLTFPFLVEILLCSKHVLLPTNPNTEILVALVQPQMSYKKLCKQIVIVHNSVLLKA